MTGWQLAGLIVVMLIALAAIIFFIVGGHK